jgi:hypothetical protein
MKYGIMILSVLILMYSCDDFIGDKKDKNDNTVSKPIEIKELDTSIELYERYYQNYTLDGCEYIEVNGGTNSAWGTHKGNCKNSIHKTDK